MLEYLGLSDGLSGLFDATGDAFSDLVSNSWFWPGMVVGVVVVILAARS